MKQFSPRWMYKKIDVHLKHSDSIWYDLEEKHVQSNADIATIQSRLQAAKLVGLSPEDLSIWKVKLLVLAESFQPVLIAFSGTDISLKLDDIQDLLDAFPKTHFWITNFIGHHPRCSILPIGNATHDPSVKIEKRNLFCITYMRPHSEDRMDLYKILHKTPFLLQYFHPFLEKEDYNQLFAKTCFSLCPSGNGADTYRFWESLCYRAVPIVKENAFYKELRHQYPKLPFLCIHEWEDLLPLVQTLSAELYEKLWADADSSCCWKDYWESKLSALVNNPSVDAHHVPHSVEDSAGEDYHSQPAQ